jgi:hypothetical protein
MSNVQPSVGYPQRGFTNAELDAAVRKPEPELTETEARAVMEWHDAITIGFAHAGIATARTSCLDVLHAPTAWSLLDIAEKSLPPDAGPVVDPYIEDHVFRSYELEARDY